VDGRVVSSDVVTTHNGIKIPNLMKIHPMEDKLFHSDGQDTTQLTVNAPKSEDYYQD
jgi:hypothetical protein